MAQAEGNTVDRLAAVIQIGLTVGAQRAAALAPVDQHQPLCEARRGLRRRCQDRPAPPARVDLPGDGEPVRSGRPFGGRWRDLFPRAFRRDLLPRAFRRDLLPRAFRRDRFVRWLAVRAEVGFLVDAADFALIDRDSRVGASGCGFGLGGRLSHARLLHGASPPGFLLALALDRVGHARGILACTRPVGIAACAICVSRVWTS